MILLLLASLATATELVDGIACVVNDDVITLSDIYENYGDVLKERCGRTPRSRSEPCVRELEAEAAEDQIMRVLVRQKLLESQMDVTEDQLERTIDSIMADNNIPSREQLKLLLSQQGFEWDAYRRQMRDDIRMMNFQQAFLAPKVRVTEDEIRDRYQRAVREYATETVLNLTYKTYTIPDESDPQAVQSFTEAVRQRTAAVASGASTLEELGDVQGVTPQLDKSQYQPSQLFDAFRPVADLKEGEVGGPYKVGGSLFVVRLDQRQAGRVLQFDEVKDQIEQKIFSERMEEEGQRWFLKARRNAAIRCTVKE
ncbi:MAG: hypothetical protein EA397_08420 [Deltaproteobacteria bacterium]|nr:MAG: hypothetical protein EA397_08420 [Deltaproteobacteria bacterium]